MKAGTGIIAMAALCSLAVAPVRADFMLTGTEEREVTDVHALGLLFDQSTADVTGGGEIESAYTNDTSVLRMVGGLAGTVRSYDRSEVFLQSGTVQGLILAYGESIVHLSGGNAGSVQARDTSTVHISGGSMATGEDVALEVHDNAAVSFSGGHAGWIHVLSGHVTFYGFDFRATGGLVIDGAEVRGVGILTGKWVDGTSWIMQIGEHTEDATIRLVTVPRFSLVPADWYITHGIRPAEGESWVDLDDRDFDGDGMTAWQEYVTGTDPNDPLSTFRIVAFDRGPPAVITVEPGVEDRHYTLQRATDLAPGAWTDVPGQAWLPADALPLTDSGSEDGVFYRVVAGMDDRPPGEEGRVIALSGDLAFGYVAVGDPAIRILTIRNEGDEPLMVTDLAFPEGFSGNWPEGLVAPGGVQEVAVRFSPGAVKPYAGDITITSNRTGGADTLPCSGTGAIRIIELEGDLAFGKVMVGETATRLLTVGNPGFVSLTVEGVGFPEGFSGDWDGGLLEPGTTQEVFVTFSPEEERAYGGTLTVSSDADEGAGSLEVSGEGGDPHELPAEELYLVVDLSAGPSAAGFPVSYQPAPPAGGWTNEHRTTLLVLRRIPAGTFVMGSPADEFGRGSDETAHQVTLTRHYYAGVFPVTQKQWERVMGTWPAYFHHPAHRDTRPVERVSYAMIRGAGAGAGWPADSGVEDGSFMGRLRARTGLLFDLPTEAQWEFAARAGTTTALNTGRNLTAYLACPNVSAAGRYWHNGGAAGADDRNATAGAGTAPVGSYPAHAWGLHDTHGNTWEWCRDRYGAYPGTVTDPAGAHEGAARVLRGGSWSAHAHACRSAARLKHTPDAAFVDLGFRVAVIMP